MWKVGFVSEVAAAEVFDLPPGLRRKFDRFVDVVEADGLMALREPNAKHVEDKIWELRLSGQEGIARSLYVTQVGQRLVILRTFVKKTQKLPRREIELARSRLASLK